MNAKQARVITNGILEKSKNSDKNFETLTSDIYTLIYEASRQGRSIIYYGKSMDFLLDDNTQEFRDKIESHYVNLGYKVNDYLISW